jgi:hypothetical protein
MLMVVTAVEATVFHDRSTFGTKQSADGENQCPHCKMQQGSCLP